MNASYWLLIGKPADSFDGEKFVLIFGSDDRGEVVAEKSAEYLSYKNMRIIPMKTWSKELQDEILNVANGVEL